MSRPTSFLLFRILWYNNREFPKLKGVGTSWDIGPLPKTDYFFYEVYGGLVMCLGSANVIIVHGGTRRINPHIINYFFDTQAC